MEKEFIKTLIQQLNQSGVKYAFTGGFVLPYYGFPKASLDVDVIIERNKANLLFLARRLREKGFSILDSDIEKAVENCEHFAVFYKNQFPYFDFKVVCDVFDEFALSNYNTVNYHGVKCRFVSPEVLIVKKIEWEDYKDVRTILQRYRKKLDMKKLTRLAKARNIYDKLQQLLEEVK